MSSKSIHSTVVKEDFKKSEQSHGAEQHSPLSSTYHTTETTVVEKTTEKSEGAGKVQEAGQWVKEKAIDAGHFINEKAHQGAEKVQEAGHWVKEKAIDAGHAIKEKTHQGAEKVKEASEGEK